MKFLTAIPVYNEERHILDVLREVRRYSPHIVVVNDGSTDRTGQILAELANSACLAHASNDEPAQRTLDVVAHAGNRGYGAALISAFALALKQDVDVLVTIDCDGQHEPSRIPVLLEAIHDADIVSASRYLRDFRQDSIPPADRMAINRQITLELNQRFGLHLTDAFCGFKAYRRRALEQLRITETGWGMPLQLWVQAACLGLRIKEIGVPRLYLDPNRAFGGVMNDADTRLAYYRSVIAAAQREALAACCFAWPVSTCSPHPSEETCP